MSFALVTESYPDVPKQPTEAIKPVVAGGKLEQPWRVVWPAKPEQNLPEQRKEDLGVPHYQLSGGRSAEFGYNDEARAQPVNEQRLEPAKRPTQPKEKSAEPVV